MMCSLFIIGWCLLYVPVTLPGAAEGLKFYLLPDFNKIVENGIGSYHFRRHVSGIFTLSLGIGAIAIFGSYIGKDRALNRRIHHCHPIGHPDLHHRGPDYLPPVSFLQCEPDSGPNLISSPAQYL